MTFRYPTHREYLKATEFARFKYKYGLVVNIIAILLFCLLIFFMVKYAQEISENPLTYGVKKYNIECNCYNYETGRNVYVNATDIIFKLKPAGFGG